MKRTTSLLFALFIALNCLQAQVASVSIALTSGTNPTCAGDQLTFTATPVNGGSAPVYQWKVDGVIVGSNSPIFSTNTFTNAQVVNCKMTSNLLGVIGNPAYSSNYWVSANSIPSANVYGSAWLCPPNGTSILRVDQTGVSPGTTYQWQMNNAPIAGATAFNYTIATPGHYNCVVTNNCGSMTSNTFWADYRVAPTITQNPLNNFVCTGGNITFSVVATSTTGLTYQWLENGLPITSGLNYSGATTSTLTLLSVPASFNQRSYSCVVNLPCSLSTTSTTAILSVGSASSPSITIIGPTNICPGGSAIYQALPTNAGATPSYQWKVNGINVGTNSIAYADIGWVTGDDITCTLTTNDVCSSASATSSSITVTVTLPINAAISASSNSICPGGSVLLSVAASPFFTYQWSLNGSNINGANASTYSVIMAGTYSCRIISSCGSGSQSNSSKTITGGALPIASITASSATSFCQGGSVMLTASSGTGYSYQWKVNGASIAGATSQTYSGTVSGTHKCTITNSCGSTTSNIITLTVLSPNATITAAGSTTFCGGGSVVLSATSVSGQTYIWKKDGTTISGATSSSYTAGSTGNYKCVVTSSCGSSTSNVISVIAGAPAKPGKVTGSTSVCANSTQNYSIVAISTATSYLWTVPSGATITAGQGTTAITVHYGASSGKVGCSAVNSCGTGVAKLVSISMNCRMAGNFADEIVTDTNAELTVFPNPFSNEAKVSFKLVKSENTELYVSDITGRVVDILFNEKTEGGNLYELNLDASSYPEGIYFLSLKTESGENFMKKLLVAR